MLKRIKQFLGIIFIVFCVALLSVALPSIWGILSNEAAKDATIKIFYTFGAVAVISLVILLIVKITGEK